LTAKSDFVPLSKAVEILGVSQSTIYRYEKAGLIKAYRTAGGHRRFSVDELSLFLEKMRNGEFVHCNAQKQLRKGAHM
jgi:excisionase family DNA binding protein